MEHYFFTDVNIGTLLFKGLNVTTTKGVLGACAVTFVATVFFEVLKLIKVYVSLRLNENPLADVQNLNKSPSLGDSTSTFDGVVLLSSLRIPVTVQQIRNRRILLHLLDSLCHLINFFYGYMLMLLVMTYSVWLTVSVVAGAAAGYFVFGAVGETLQLRYKLSQTSHASPGNNSDQTPTARNVQAQLGEIPLKTLV